MEIVNEITKGDFVLVEFRFQLQGIYEVLDIVATAINNLQKNGVPYHMLFWEKERVNTMIANVNCLCYLSPHHSAEEIISNIQAVSMKSTAIMSMKISCHSVVLLTTEQMMESSPTIWSSRRKSTSEDVIPKMALKCGRILSEY